MSHDIELGASPHTVTVSAGPGSEHNWLAAEKLGSYDHLLRWWAYRAYRRSQKLELKCSRGARFLCLALFAWSVSVILMGWCFQADEIARNEIAKYTKGWNLIPKAPYGYPKPSDNIVSVFSVLAAVAVISMLHVKTDEWFLTISSGISYYGICGFSILFLVEVFAIYPSCWIPFLPRRIKAFCMDEHDLIWRGPSLMFVGCHAVLGLGVATWDVLQTAVAELFLKRSALACIIGPAGSVSKRLSITDRASLREAVRRCCSNADSRVVTALLRSKERRAFVAFTLKGWTVFPCGSFRSHDAAYLGEVDSYGQPHGIGCWADLRSQGEMLAGYWEDGLPRAPFESFCPHQNATFAAARVAFAHPTTEASRRGYGIAEVECCISGNRLRHFPCLLRVRPAPNLRRSSVDVSLSLFQNVNPRAPPACAAEERSSGDNSESLTSPDRPTGRNKGGEEFDAAADALDCLASDSRRPLTPTSAARQSPPELYASSWARVSPGQLAFPVPTQTVVVLVPPLEWTFHECLLCGGTFAALLGVTSGVAVVVVSHRRPTTPAIDRWMHALVPCASSRVGVLASAGYLDHVLQQLPQPHVVALGSGAPALVSAIAKDNASRTLESVVLVAPVGRDAAHMKDMLQRCRAASQRHVTVYAAAQGKKSSSWCRCAPYRNVVAGELDTVEGEALEALLADDEERQQTGNLCDLADVIDVTSVLRSDSHSGYRSGPSADSLAGCVATVVERVCEAVSPREPPAARILAQSAVVVEDIRCAIMLSQRAAERHPVLRQISHGVWSFQHSVPYIRR